jgi:hypothetical protein
LFVLAKKILVEPRKEQLLDAGITLGRAQRIGLVRVGAEGGVVNAGIIQGSASREQGTGSGTGDQGGCAPHSQHPPIPDPFSNP